MRVARAVALLGTLAWSAYAAAQAAPDLVMRQVSGPATAPAGGTISVTTTVTASAAGGAAGSFRVGIYLSSDPTVITGGTLLGYRTVSKLAAGASSTAATSVKVPAALRGTYYLGAIADDAGAIAEADETNNAVLAGALEVVGPDLTVLAVNGPASAGAGTTVDVVTSVVADATGGNAGASRVGIYLSADPTITADDRLLGSRYVSSLAAGGTSTGTTSVNLPLGLAGAYYLGAVADYADAVEESNESNNALAGSAVTIVPPDLTVSLVGGPAGAGAGTAIAVDTTVAADALGGAASSFGVGIYLSSDPFIATDDKLLGYRTVSSLAPGATSSGTKTVTIPGGLRGTYYLGAVADHADRVAESDETNNAATGNAIDIAGPDLTVAAVSGPAQAGAGASIDVTTTVAAADAKAGSFRVGVYLSADPTITTDDVRLGSRYVSSLAVGATSTGTTSVKLPLGSSGPFYLGAIADDLDSVAEGDETNNAAVGNAIDVAGPDLAVTSVSGPASAGAGATVGVATSVSASAAGGAARSFRVGIYLSADPVIAPDDKLLGTRSVSGLAAGATSDATTSVKLPAGIRGRYYLGAIADSTGLVAESDESNNALAGNAIDVAGPDLAVTAVSGPEQAGAGSSVQVSTAVTALASGGAVASSSRAGIYLSADPTITTADTLLGYRSVGSLAAGATSSATTTVRIPLGLRGAFYLGAIADCADAIAEGDESNNALAGNAIQVLGPDLAMVSVSAPARAGAGATVDVATTVGADGAGGNAGAFRVGIYLSTDPVITREDRLLESRWVSSLAAGATSSATTTVKIPLGLQGTYYLGAIADYLDAVAESDEDDNASSGVPLLVAAPDLRVAASAPASAGAGTAVDVTTAVTADATGGNAGAFRVGIYLSTDPVITPEDRLLGSRWVSSLAAGATNTASKTVTLPRGLVGTYYVGAIADYLNAVAESEESNNASPGGAIELLAPDLTVASVAGPAASSPGALVDVTTGVAAGADGGSAGASRVGIYLSTDEDITTSDKLLGYRTVSALPAGATSEGTTQVVIPAGASGVYYVGAIADYLNAVAESDESNNARAGAAITIGADVTPPAIAVTGVADGEVRNTSLTVCYGSPDPDLSQISATLDGADFPGCGSVYLEGDHVLVVDAVDAAGNAARSVIQFALDFTPPEIQVTGVADGQLSAAASLAPAFSATDAHLAGVSAALDGNPFVGGAVSEEGEHLLAVSAADLAGNTTERAVRFALDRTPPTIHVTGVAEGQVSRAPLAPAFEALDAHPGTAAASLDGAQFASGAEVSAEGPHVLVVNAADAAGNAAPAQAIHFTIDRTLPALSVASPSDGALLGATSVEVVASATDALGLASVSANGVALALQADGLYHGSVPLSEGNNVVLVVARDAAGNEATATVSVARDTTPPVLVVTSPADGATVAGDSVEVSGTVQDQRPLTLTVDSQPVAVAADGSFHTSVAVASGPHTIVIAATDAAGNTATVQRDVTVQEGGAPTLVVLEPADGLLTSSATVTVRGTAAGGTLPLSVTVNGAAAALEADGSFQALVALSEGDNALLVVARDAAGQEARVTVSVARDSAPPVLVVTTPADGATVTGGAVEVTGTVHDARAVTLTVDGQPVTVAADGSFDASVTLAPGPHTLQLVARDAAGNTASLQRSITVEAAPPTLTVVEPRDGFVTSSATVTVRGTVTGGTAPVSVTVNGAPAAPGADGAFSVTLDLPVGAVTIAVHASDAGGRVADASVSGTRSASDGGGSGSGLSVAFDAPAEGAVLRGRVAVSGRIEGGQPPYDVTVLGVKATVNSMYFGAALDLAEGDQVIVVEAKDAAGNGGAAQRTVSVDTTPPYLSVTRPAAATSQVTESPYLVEGDVGDVHLASVTVNGQLASLLAGHFSAAVPLAAGANDVTVVARDLAGNEASKVVRLEVSALPPTVVVLEPADGREAAAASVRVRVSASGTSPITGVTIGMGAAALVDGAWEATVPLALGDNTIVATATDAAGLSSSARVHVRYRDAAQEPLAVTGVDPAAGATAVEQDSLVSVSFNKAIDPATLNGHFTVSASGTPLSGSFYVAPGAQTASFVARAPLPPAQRLEVRVAGVSAAAGPGMSGAFASSFSTRPVRTSFQGVVMDDAYQPIPNVRVSIEGTDRSALTVADGSWAFIDAPSGAAVLRIEGGIASGGARLPTIRRRAFIDGNRDGTDGMVLLTPIDTASAQYVDASGPVHIDFAGRYPGLALDVPAEGLFFESGKSAGAITATRVEPSHAPVPIENGNTLSGLWQVQPPGIRLAQPVQVKLPNVSGLPAGRLAILATYDTTRHMLVRSGVGEVSEDGAAIESTAAVSAQGLDFIGYVGLNEAQDGALRQALSGTTEPPEAPPATGALERIRRDGLAGFLRMLLWPLGSRDALAQLGFLGSSPPLYSVDSYGFSRACGVHGRIRTAYDYAPISMSASAPTADASDVGTRVRLPYALPVSFQASARSGGAPVGVRVELAASRAGIVLAAPAGDSWRSDEVYGTAGLSTSVALVPGSTTTLTLSARAGADSRSIVFEARLDPLAGSDGAAQEAMLHVVKKFDASDSATPPASYFKGWTVEARGMTTASDVSGDYGQFQIPVCSVGDAFACADVKTGTRFVNTKETLPDGGQRVLYTPVGTSLKLCSTAFNYVTIPTFHRSDIIADLRVLAGKLTLRNRDGSEVGGRCDADAVTRRTASGLESISPDDLGTTEVHFFREDQQFKDPIARFTVAIPGTQDGARCDAASHARYVRVRMGPQAAGMRYERNLCAALAANPSPDAQREYQATCASLARTNFTRLSPGDRLVAFAVNHATGWAGMKTVIVPDVTQRPGLSPGESCPADDAAGGPIHFTDSWASFDSNQTFTISRCAQSDVFIDVPIELYPPEIDVRVARERRDQGASDGSSRTQHLVRTGGSATTTDDVIQVSTHWRVRLGVPPPPSEPPGDDGSPPEDDGTSPPPDGGETAWPYVPEDVAKPGPKADPTDARPTDPGAEPNGGPGEPLELYCSELPANASAEARRRCAQTEQYLADVPAGVPALAAQVVRVTGTAVEQPAVSIFRVAPGRSTGNVQTTLRLIAQDGSATTLPNLTVANYYVHVVGHSLLFNDLNGNGQIEPEELERRDPPPPDLGITDLSGPVGLPTRALSLKDVYLSQEPDGAQLQRYDVGRELEFRVVGLDLASATATQGVDGTRRLDDPEATAPPAAELTDTSYQFLMNLVTPETPGRAGTLKGDLKAWLGSDQYGVECDLAIQGGAPGGGEDTLAAALTADCGGEYLYDVLSARDLVYFEIFLSGNGENVLYRYNFHGLTRRLDYVTAGRKDTAADAVRPDEDGEPALLRSVSMAAGAEFYVRPGDMRKGTATVCLDPSCEEETGVLKKARLELQIDGSYEVTDEDGTVEAPLSQADTRGSDGSRQFHLPLPNELTEMPGADAVGRPIYLVLQPEAEPGVTTPQPLKYTLGKPRGEFSGAHARAAGHSDLAGVDLADGHLSFRHEDLALPELGSMVRFGRTYDNQDNQPGAVGTGWRHDYEGFVVEERLGRYTVVLAGQSYDFRRCAQVDQQNRTATDCLTDNAHGGTLTVQRTAADRPDVVYEASNGWRYRFDRLSVMARPLMAPRTAGGEPDALPGRRRWVLTAIDDGHARSSSDTSTAGWQVVEYYAKSDMVRRVARNGGRLALEFGYEAVPDTALQTLKVTARRDNLGFLRTVTAKRGEAAVVTVTLTQDPQNGNLLGANRSTGDGYAYTYQPVRTGLAGDDAWAAVNELRRVEYRVHGQRQSYVEYGRSEQWSGFPHERAAEVVDRVTLPGYDGQVFAIGYSAGAGRTVTRPDGVVARVSVNAWGNATGVELPLSSSGYRWESDTAGGRVFQEEQQIAGLRTVAFTPDTDDPATSRLRARAVELRDAQGSAVAGLSGSLAAMTLDARFGRPTSTTRPASSGAASFATPLSPTGDPQGITVVDPTHGTVLQTSRQVDADGVPTTETDGAGRTTTYSAPDGWGLPTVAEVAGAAAGGGRDRLRRAFVRDGLGRLSSVTDDLGRGETWTYDDVGRLTARTVLGTPPQAWSWAYEEGDNALTVTETQAGTGHERESIYRDGRLREERVLYDQGKTAVRTYTWERGRLTKVELRPAEEGDPQKPVTYTYGYDAEGRVASMTAAGTGPARTTSYNGLDGEGKPHQVVDATGLTTEIGYDVLGRPSSWDRHVPDGLETVERDVSGAVTRHAFGAGHTVTGGTDALGTPRSATGAGLSTTFEYDAAGRLEAKHDREMGLDEAYEYDVADRVVKYTRTVTGSAVLKLEETRAYEDVAPGMARVTVTRAIETGSGQRTEIEIWTVDGRGRLQTKQETVGGRTVSWGYVYDPRGMVTSVAGPLSWLRAYDGEGHLVSATDEAGKRTSYRVDATGLVTRKEGPHPENIWTYEYDGAGQLLSKKLEQPGGALSWTYTHGVDGPGTVRETDPKGYTTTRTQDALGRLVKEARAGGGGSFTTTYEYEGRYVKKRTSTEGSWSLAVETSQDDRGRELGRSESWSAPGGSYSYATSTPWSGRATPLSETWRSGGRTESRSGSIETDGLGHVIERVVGGARDLWAYDALGLVVKEELAGRPERGWSYSGPVPTTETYGTDPATTYTYFETGRPQTITDPSGRVRRLSWDARGMLTGDQYGDETLSWTFDEGGYPKSMTQNGATWTYDSGPRGELRSAVDPNGTTFRYGRDELARLSSIEVDPAAGSTPRRTFEYDYLDRETVRTRGTATWGTSWSSGEGTTILPTGDGVTVLLDGRGRVARKTFSAGGGSVAGLSSVSYAYNGLDALVQAEEAGVDGSATTRYVHDGRGLLLSVERTGAPEVGYGYRASGELASMSASGQTVSYGYDGMERVSSVTGPAGTVNVGWETGGVRLETLSGPSLCQRRCYDDSGRLTEILNATGPVACGDTGPTLLAGYVYDHVNGRLTSETYLSQGGPPEVTSYGYDAAIRLTGVQYPDHAELYQLAGDGTRLGEKRAANAPLLDASGFGAVTGATEHLAYHYDDGRGALTSITDELNAGAVAATFTVDAAGHVKGETRGGTIKTYDWDAEGRLRSVEVRPPAPGAPWTASYAYDHSGRRVSKSGTAGVTSYLWGAGELVSETPAGGTALVYQQLGDLAVAVGGEQLMHDGLGSVVGRIGAGAPTLYRYDAWGGFRSSDAPATGQPSLAYAGQHWDADAGLSYAQQRWYDAATGRFLSEDPVFGELQQPNSLHAFGYANGNPLAFTDPTGELGVKPINEADSTRQMDYWWNSYHNASDGSAQQADALQKYQFWKNEAQDARENRIFAEEVGVPLTVDAVAAAVVGPFAKAYRVVRWGLGAMSAVRGAARLKKASAEKGTQRTADLIGGAGELVGGGLMFTPEVVKVPGALRRAFQTQSATPAPKPGATSVTWENFLPQAQQQTSTTRNEYGGFDFQLHDASDTKGALGVEIDAAFGSGRAQSGTMIQFRDAKGPLTGSGPKQGAGAIWYHDNVTIPGAGPAGEAVEVRTHAPNPNAPPGSYSRSNYTTQINTKDGRYRLPDGNWKRIKDMTPAERAAAHIPAGN
jgi:RHS repeat-associated protein